MAKTLAPSVQAVIGGESESEAKLLRRLARAGLPTPETQQRLVGGRQYRWDACWFRWKVAVEVQGAIWKQGRHTRGGGFEEDCVKAALVQIEGWITIAVTPGMITNGLAVDLISRALLARGWPGLL
jgi:hypothetical protein